ncbi:endonuclease Q family protein [Patescibacteria group bacterium]
MTLPVIADWARKKGIQLVATGDWTHPLWIKEIEKDLEETGTGLLKLRTKNQESKTTNQTSSPLFLLATEISSIYTQNGKGRRVHTLVWVPNIDSARKIGKEMTKQGCNLMSDGRPITGLSNIQLADIVFTIEPDALVIPAHAWTPWFSLYGSMSGFDSIEESFGEYANQIYAVETGLSSSPAMNWRIKELDNRSIISCSDAHSMPKLGRETTVIKFEARNSKHETLMEHFTYQHLYEAIAGPFKKIKNPKAEIVYTTEFYPEEGKYHYTGHRSCNVRLTPEAEVKKGSTCSVCGKKLTQGVMQRVEELAGRSEKDLDLEIVPFPVDEHGKITVPMTASKTFPNRPPYTMLVPLQEIISECLEKGVNTKTVVTVYDKLIETLGGEFTILLTSSIDDITEVAGDRIAQGIDKVRKGKIVVDPGYDGVFGVVKLWRDGEEKPLVDASKEQLSMF